jgi:hypothetical protein
MTKDKAEDFMARNVNIVRERTTIGSKAPDILIKNIKIAGVEDHYWEGSGLPPRPRLESLGRTVSSVKGVLEEYTRSGVSLP